MNQAISDIRREIGKHLLDPGAPALPLWPITADRAETFADAPEASRAWLKASGWRHAPGACALLPGPSGAAGAIYGAGADAFIEGALPAALPEGDYYFSAESAAPELAALAWCSGAYAFTRYSGAEKRAPRRLRLANGVDREKLLNIAQAVWFGRELINTPANDMGPAELEAASRALALDFGARASVTAGDDLLKGGFRLLHAVGRASDRAPRLIDLVWGAADAPKVTVIGKGVCFDTGGLNIKTGGAMLLMKKDMGGAAAALSLAAMIMAERLPIRLRVLIAAADNSIGANAFRPGDIIKSRAGLTVEIGNTDAEGRLALADALSLAEEEAPETIVTFATLTGAARIALGPDLPPFYTDDETLAASVAAASMRVADPLWRMPLWPPYEAYLKSEAADMNNAGGAGFAGSIAAALFLKRFMAPNRRFLHLDIYGWTPKTLPGKPAGGEPQGARAVFEVLARHYGGDAP